MSYIYTRGFEVFRMGYASALSVVLLGLILIITVIMYSAMLKGETMDLDAVRLEMIAKILELRGALGK